MTSPDPDQSPEAKRERRNEYMRAYNACDLSRLRATQKKYRATDKARRGKSVRSAKPQSRARMNSYAFQRTHGIARDQLPPPPDDSRCECCNATTIKLNWDHDHELEALGFSPAATHRGWICHGCNTGLGKLGDNVQGVRRALDYLSRLR